jgi:hypothetical protein
MSMCRNVDRGQIDKAGELQPNLEFPSNYSIQAEDPTIPEDAMVM